MTMHAIVRLTLKEAQALEHGAGNSFVPALSWEEVIRDLFNGKATEARAFARAMAKLQDAIATAKATGNQRDQR